MDLFEGSFAELFRFATQNLTFKMDVLEAFVVRQACDLLQGLIPLNNEKDIVATEEHYQRLYVFVLMWSIGAFLELDDRAKMEEFLRKYATVRLDLPPQNPGTEFSMFDYMVENSGKQFSRSAMSKCNLK